MRRMSSISGAHTRPRRSDVAGCRRDDRRMNSPGLSARASRRGRAQRMPPIVIGMLAARRGVLSALCASGAPLSLMRRASVFPYTLAFQRGDDFADGVVHAFAHCQQRCPRSLLPVLNLAISSSGACSGAWTAFESQIGKNGSSLCFENEGRKPPRQPVREVAFLLDRSVPRINRVGGVIELEVIVRTATEKAKHLIKAAQCRAPLRRGTEMPFAELSGDVTRRLQMLGKDRLAHRQPAACLAAGIEPQRCW